MQVAKKYKIIILILIAIVISFWVILNSFIGKQKMTAITDLLSYDQQYLIKKYIFPYKVIKQHEATIDKLDANIHKQSDAITTLSNKLELIFRENLTNIEIQKVTEKELSNGLLLKNYYLIDGFYAGITTQFAGSGYLDFHLNATLH